MAPRLAPLLVGCTLAACSVSAPTEALDTRADASATDSAGPNLDASPERDAGEEQDANPLDAGHLRDTGAPDANVAHDSGLKPDAPVVRHDGGPVSMVHVATSSLPPAAIGALYEATIEAAGGVGPFSWRIAGLPAGLSAGGSTDRRVEISGTPVRTSRATSVAIEVMDSRGQVDSRALTIDVLDGVRLDGPLEVEINPCARNEFTLRASGDLPPYSFSASGPAPVELQLRQAQEELHVEVARGAPGATRTLQFVVAGRLRSLATLDVAATFAPAFVIDAGADRDVLLGETVQITASPPPPPNRIEWRIVRRPPGSRLPLFSVIEQSPTLSFSPDQGGVYELEVDAHADRCHARDRIAVRSCGLWHGRIGTATVTPPGRPLTMEITGATSDRPIMYTWRVDAPVPVGAPFAAGQILGTQDRLTFTSTAPGQYNIAVELSDGLCVATHRTEVLVDAAATELLHVYTNNIPVLVRIDASSVTCPGLGPNAPECEATSCTYRVPAGASIQLLSLPLPLCHPMYPQDRFPRRGHRLNFCVPAPPQFDNVAAGCSVVSGLDPSYECQFTATRTFTVDMGWVDVCGQ